MWDSTATLQSQSKACPRPSTSAKRTVVTNPNHQPVGVLPPSPSSKLLLQVTSARMLRSALSRLAPAAAASHRCTPTCLSAFGGQPLSVQPLSGSLQQTRSVISVKVYPGKLQAAQRALTRVLMGDKVCNPAHCTTCGLPVKPCSLARSM